MLFTREERNKPFVHGNLRAAWGSGTWKGGWDPPRFGLAGYICVGAYRGMQPGLDNPAPYVYTACSPSAILRACDRLYVLNRTCVPSGKARAPPPKSSSPPSTPDSKPAADADDAGVAPAQRARAARRPSSRYERAAEEYADGAQTRAMQDSPVTSAQGDFSGEVDGSSGCLPPADAHAPAPAPDKEQTQEREARTSTRAGVEVQSDVAVSVAAAAAVVRLSELLGTVPRRRQAPAVPTRRRASPATDASAVVLRDVTELP